MILLLLALFGCGGKGTPCDLEAIARDRAGTGAVACGLGDVDGADDDAIRACIVEAWEGDQAFYGITQEVVAGGLFARAWVSNGETTDILTGDYWGCDDAGCYGQVLRFPCAAVASGDEAVSSWLVCSTPDAGACGEVLCGHGEGCGG